MTGRDLLAPDRLWSRSEVLARPGPVPAAPGVYGWYFTTVPPGVPVDGCHTADGAVLLYVGISPRRPAMSGARTSKQNLQLRLRSHYRGDAASSTLRLTLGSLLADELGIVLRRIGDSGARLTFGAGEEQLSQWMDRHARVCWATHPEPWLLETELIHGLVLPLNLEQNADSPFRARLSRARAHQRDQARTLPPLPR